MLPRLVLLLFTVLLTRQLAPLAEPPVVKVAALRNHDGHAVEVPGVVIAVRTGTAGARVTLAGPSGEGRAEAFLDQTEPPPLPGQLVKVRGRVSLSASGPALWDARIMARAPPPVLSPMDLVGGGLAHAGLPVRVAGFVAEDRVALDDAHIRVHWLDARPPDSTPVVANGTLIAARHEPALLLEVTDWTPWSPV